MKRLLHLIILTGLFLSSVAVHSVVHADAVYDAGYQIGQGIARNMFEPSMRTVPTEEYINQNYNAKTIFVFSVIPDGFDQFIESRYGVEYTTGLVGQALREKGFEVMMPIPLLKALAEQGMPVESFDNAQITSILNDMANTYADATCKVKILSYRMIPWNNSAKAEATLEIVVTDQKTGTEIYSYTRQFIRADLPLAPNDPNKMVKKIGSEFANRLAKKVAADQKRF